ncbi:MAG: 50S ribosomal protein L19 [Patescibacteria group bacterium]
MAIKANWNQKVDFGIGDTVKILYTIKDEGKKDRVQPFEGVVIAIRGGGASRTFTLRKIAVDKIGVERIFPLNSPWIQDLKVTKKPKNKITRAKLYFLRNKPKKGKKRIL